VNGDRWGVVKGTDEKREKTTHVSKEKAHLHQCQECVSKKAKTFWSFVLLIQRRGRKKRAKNRQRFRRQTAGRRRKRVIATKSEGLPKLPEKIHNQLINAGKGLLGGKQHKHLHSSAGGWGVWCVGWHAPHLSLLTGIVHYKKGSLRIFVV